MPEIARTTLILAAVLWGIGWALACLIDATIARWPEAAATRDTVPPMPIRWLLLLILWPRSLYAVLGSRHRTR